MQRNANHVDLEKCWKVYLYSPVGAKKTASVCLPSKKYFGSNAIIRFFAFFLPLGMATRHALKNLEIFRNFQEIRRGPWTPAAGFRPMAKPMAKSMAKPTAKPTAKPMAKPMANSGGSDGSKFRVFLKNSINSGGCTSPEFFAYDRQCVSLLENRWFGRFSRFSTCFRSLEASWGSKSENQKILLSLS